MSREVSLSREGRHQISDLRSEAARDVAAGLPYPMLDARLQDVAVRFRAVVDGDLAQQSTGEDHTQSHQTVAQDPEG